MTIQALLLLGILLGCGHGDLREVAVSRHPNGNRDTVKCFAKDGRLVLVRTYHFNQVLASETEYKDGKPDGEFRRWGTAGHLEETGAYRNGLRDGDGETWYMEGKKLTTFRYRNDLLDGEREEYFSNGDHKRLETWSAGKPVGTWNSWFPNGQLESRDGCHPDVPKGVEEHYNDAGVLLSSQECSSGIPDGLTLENFPDGKPKLRGAYSQGLRTGTWRWSRADGSPWNQSTFRAGLRDGAVIHWGLQGDSLRFDFTQGSGTIKLPCPRESGLPQTVACAESTWVAGKLDGLLTGLDPVKRIRSKETWKAGMLQHSEACLIKADGQDSLCLLSGGWVNGHRDGFWRTWHRNGRLKDSLHYQAGEFYGMQFSYDSTGHLYLAKEHSGIKNQVLVHTLDPRPFDTTQRK